MSDNQKPIQERNEPPLFVANDPGKTLQAAEAARRAEFDAAAKAQEKLDGE